ncbi:porin [Candidatus Pelagibacter ubique]|nr:porin [Candidatus Pelagibacter ubique]
MNNLKKIGLSALAGSLVAISANAAELSVSGSVEVTYTDTGGTVGNEVTGNSFGAKSDMTFTGSGDVGFGTVTMNRALSDAGAITTSYQTLDMGDMGTFSFDSTAGQLVGIAANDDLMPTAYEEVWTGVSGSGIAGVGSTNVIGYTNTFAGVSISAGYTNGEGATQTGESAASGAGAHGSTRDIYLSMSPIDGLTIGAGQSVNSSTDTGTTSTDTTESVAQVVYTMGPVSAGYRIGESEDGTASTASHSITAWSIAFNVNENFAISYGEQENEQNAIGAVAAVAEDVTGLSAAYTMGAASVRFNHSESSNDNFVAAVDDETTEISLALSF